MPGIAQSRWVFFVHCVRSVGKILSQMSGRLERLLPKQAKAFLSPWTGCDRKDRDVVKEKKRKRRSDRLKFRKGRRVSGFSRSISRE